MRTLKEFFLKSNKVVAYRLYTKINPKPVEIEKITKLQIYEYIIDAYIADPEIILNLCTMEEIDILKNLLDKSLPIKNAGYIEYLLFLDLKTNFLINEDEDKYFIFEDLINPVKMAMNLYSEKEYSLKDVMDGVLLGLIRVHNVCLLNDYLKYLEEYNIIYNEKSLKKYLKNNLKIKDKIDIIKYKNKLYVISLEYPFHKDVLALSERMESPVYSLEEMISYGKYKINLFQETIFHFLNFLEVHLYPEYIDLIMNDVIIYAGFNLNDQKTLINISDNIKELQAEIEKALPYFPVWIYNGKCLKELEEKNN